MLFSVSFVSARMCDTDNVLDVLRKALYIYYTDSSKSSFEAEDLRNLLTFYVNIQSGQITIDCTEQSDKIDKANALPDNIPSCSDMTKYGKCSRNKPMYCYAGRLVPRCRLCGCPESQWCDITYVYTEKGNKGQWGKCYPGKNTTCSVDSDCGTSTYIGDYYCSTGQESTLHIGDVYRKYHKYECFDAGKNNATCFNWTDSILIDDCSATEQCVEGEAECQIIEQPPINQTCSEGTQYGQCSTTKPKYCINGNLTNNCQVCGCNEYYKCLKCQADNTCEFKAVSIATGTAIQQDPDIYGNRIVWVDKPKSYNIGNIYIHDLLIQETQMIVVDGNMPDIYGDKIVFRKFNSEIGWAVAMYDLSTGQETRITEYTSGQPEPQIYGDKIVWTDWRSGYSDIYMYDLSTGQETQITMDSTLQRYPSIYGDRIVWMVEEPGIGWGVYVYDLSIKKETRIGKGGNPIIYGDKVVYADGWRIYLYDLSTGQKIQITTGENHAGSPYIYGDKVVWFGWGGVHVYDLSTRQDTQITTNPINMYYPAIYDNNIIWTDMRSGNEDIYMATIC